MRIALDAKWFFSGNPSGRVWIRNVLEQLINNHPDHKYIILDYSASGHMIKALSTIERYRQE